MLKISQEIVFIFVLCCVHFGHGQFDPWREPNRNSFESYGTQDVKSTSSGLDGLSIFADIRKLIPDLDEDSIIRMYNDSKCNRDVAYLSNIHQDENLSAIKMLDAFGKPESGFLEGNFKWLGNFHECTNIYVPLNKPATAGGFKGQYCSVDLSVAIMKKIIPLTVGICIPNSCESELTQFKDTFSLMNPTPSLVNFTKLTCHATSRNFSSGAIGMIFLLTVFVALAAVGSGITAYEYFYEIYKTRNMHDFDYGKTDNQINVVSDKQDNEGSAVIDLHPAKNQMNGWYAKLKPFFSCFCVFTNGEKLLNTDGTEGQLLCLHGIRFLSMSWVIVCHVYAFCIPAVGNLVETISLIDVFPFQIIMNGSFSVDTFFLLSGFLVAYLFFQESAKSNGKFPWIYFYVHRYIRLTPVYMIILGMYTTLSYHMGSGPFWTTNKVEPVCRDNWIYNILYINNFVSVPNQCFNWSWYLANDMQFFIISPLFLITLRRWPTIGFSIIGIFVSASFAINFGLTYHYDLLTGLGDFANFIGDPEYTARQSLLFEKIYIKPYTRITPYLVGIVLAYYLFRRKENNEGKVNLTTLCCGWIIAPVVTLICMFAIYHRTLTTVANCFYNSLRRTGFAAGVGWVIFTCLIGQGGPVNSILSFKPFIVFSRLTYSAYLIHPVIIYGYFGALKSTLHFSQMTMVTMFFGLLMITYFASFLISVLFESPIIKLDKLVRTKFRA